MIKNIIFDIGQVLAAFRWKEYIKAFGFTEEMNERLAKATVLSPYWNEVDRGVKTQEEIIELCTSIDPAIESEIRLFFKDPTNMVIEFDYSKDWIVSLKKMGYHIYILSNYGEYQFAHVKNVFQFLKYVDGAVISYEVKCIKPEPKIYQTLLDRYQLKGEECVFIDDLNNNLIGAKAFGIETILFQNQEQAMRDLQKLGITV